MRFFVFEVGGGAYRTTEKFPVDGMVRPPTVFRSLAFSTPEDPLVYLAEAIRRDWVEAVGPIEPEWRDWSRAKQTKWTGPDVDLDSALETVEGNVDRRREVVARLEWDQFVLTDDPDNPGQLGVWVHHGLMAEPETATTLYLGLVHLAGHGKVKNVDMGLLVEAFPGLHDSLAGRQ